MELLKLAAVFILILIFLGRGKPMYIVMPAAAVLIGLLFAMPPLAWLTACGQSVISESTIMVVFTVWLVMLLEGLMSRYGYLQRLMEAIDGMFHSRRVNIFSMPMIIGFLPSAGGALLSAPMVEAACAACGLSNEDKTNINNYYRHVMEVVFPTHSTLIVMSQASGIPLPDLMISLVPIFIVIVLIGLLMLRKVPRGRKADPAPVFPRLGRLLFSLWPFILLLTLILALKIKVHYSCALTLLAVIIATKTKISELPALIREKTKWRLLAITLSIMVFKDVLLMSGALEALPEIISVLPVPPLIIYSLLCLFIGMITGVSLSAVAIVVPLLFVTMPDFTAYTLAFLHISSYIGVQLTPTHSCIVLSAEYFQARLNKAIAKYLPYYALVYLAALLLYAVLLS